MTTEPAPVIDEVAPSAPPDRVSVVPASTSNEPPDVPAPVNVSEPALTTTAPLLLNAVPTVADELLTVFRNVPLLVNVPAPVIGVPVAVLCRSNVPALVKVRPEEIESCPPSANVTVPWFETETDSVSTCPLPVSVIELPAAIVSAPEPPMPPPVHRSSPPAKLKVAPAPPMVSPLVRRTE